MVEQLVARKGFALATHQKEEHLQLIRGKCKRLFSAEKLLLITRKAQISDGNIPVRRISASFHLYAAKKRFNAHQENRRAKRLGQIVVPALQNTVDVIVFGILCRQKNDGNTVPLTDKTAAGKSVGPGHHNIQNNKIGASFKKRA